MEFRAELSGLQYALSRLDAIAQRLSQSTDQAVRSVTARALAQLRQATPRSNRGGQAAADAYQAQIQGSGLDIQGTIRVGGEGAFKIMLLLNGSAPHMIHARRGMALAFPWRGGAEGGGIFFFRSVRHPGTQPHQPLVQAMNDIRTMADEEAIRLASNV